MASVEAALAGTLRQQEPYPAIVMDCNWNVIRADDFAPTLFGKFSTCMGWRSPKPAG
jgi:hypothetical protein